MAEQVVNGNFLDDFTGWTRSGCPDHDDWEIEIYPDPWPDGPLACAMSSFGHRCEIHLDQDVDFTDVEFLTFSAIFNLAYWDPFYGKGWVCIDDIEVFSAGNDFFDYTEFSVDVSAFTGIHTLSFRVVGDDYGASAGLRAISAISIPPAPPPITDFSASPLSGGSPLLVRFADLSTNTPTSWLWNFGDGLLSAEQNPLHSYAEPGFYTVTLKAANPGGFDLEVKSDYISILYGPKWTIQIGPLV